MRIHLAILLALLISLIALPILKSQLYYGVSYGCNYIIVAGSSDGTGLIELIPTSGSPTVVKIGGTSVLNSIALNGCTAIVVGSSSGGNPAYVIYNLTSGSYKVVTINGIGELYGVAYGDGYYVAVGLINNTGLIVRITNGGYRIISPPAGYRVLYGVSFGDGGFLILGEGANGAALGFYNLSSDSLIDLSGELPSTYYVLYSAAYGSSGFMVVGMGEVNSSGFIIQIPVAGLLNVTSGSFIDLSSNFRQYSLLMSVAYMDYEYVFTGSTTGGQGGYGYYSIYGLTPLYSTVGSGNLYLPFILYSVTPVSPGIFYVVGNNGESSVGSEIMIPAIYNATFISNVNDASITVKGPISLNVKSNTTVPLPQGSYNVTVEARGYYNVTKIIMINSNEVVNLTLSKVKYCNIILHVNINGTSEPVVNASITLISKWPNVDYYSTVTNASGMAFINAVCNNYKLRITAPNFINETYAINANSTININVSLVPIVNVILNAPNMIGEYKVRLMGIVNGSIILNNSSSYSFRINKVGLMSIIIFRLINNLTQYLGEVNACLKPGLNVINLTWETPVIESMSIKQVLPGNVSAMVYVNLSKVGNLSINLSLNGSIIFSENAINTTGVQLTRNFTESGVYLVCAYTWSILNGTKYIDYGPVCLPINVVIHSELIIMDESGILLRLAGYYLGNSTVNITLPAILTFNNGTRLVYNGSLFNGEYMINNSFVIKLSKIINYLEVLWVKEYLVKTEVFIGDSLVNATERWIVNGSVIKYPSIIYLGNGTRLINETGTEIMVRNPLVLVLKYIKQYAVTIREYSSMGVFNESQIWINANSILKIPLAHIIYLSNNTRLRPTVPELIIKVNEPIIVNASYIIQFLVEVIRRSNLGIFNITYLWVNSDSLINLVNTITQLSNSTRFIPKVTELRFNVTSPMIINDMYTVQYLVINETIIDGSLWVNESKWVNESSTLPITPSTIINLGNSTRLILSQVCVNGVHVGYNTTVTVNKPLNISYLYYKQWYITLNIYTINGSLLNVESQWVNSSNPIVRYINWSNLTVPLTTPLIVHASMVTQPIEATAGMLYKVFSVKDYLKLPIPFTQITVKCSNYTVTQVSNAYGVIKVLVPVNQECLIKKPAMGYYSLALITVLLVAIITLLIRLVKR